MSNNLQINPGNFKAIAFVMVCLILAIHFAHA